MYATGVGLVIKGFEYLQREQRRGLAAQNPHIAGHSENDKKGKWFESFIKKTQNWFDEDTDELSN